MRQDLWEVALGESVSGENVPGECKLPALPSLNYLHPHK